MHSLLAWLDHRTGYRRFVYDALYESVPGGSRWRYVWGSTLVFTFALQVITGVFLWMCYSPSAQTAWESVFYIEHGLAGGSLLRGIHHYAAQAMVILLALHLMQVVIDGAYRAPREFNFWIGLVLMLIVLGLALTGYLLPWDQKGYWATKVATRISGLAPVIGPEQETLVVGGSDYGNLTLTRFFALHAGVLPGLLIFFLAIHLALFRRHGVTPRDPDRRPTQTFWPDQVLKDAVACLMVLVTVVLLALFLRAELGAPANPADEYSAARPEWYFLFLFQFLKYFPGHTGEQIAAIYIPLGVLVVLALMPIVGRRKLGHRFNVAFVFFVLAGAVVLTGLAIRQDYQARWVAESEYDDVTEVLTAIEIDLRKDPSERRYQGKDEPERLLAYFEGDQSKYEAFRKRYQAYQGWQQSESFIAAKDQAEADAERAVVLAEQGIPPTGALSLVRDDPKLQGPRLFRRHCAACHNHVDPQGQGIQQPRPLVYKEEENDDGEKVKVTVPNGAPNLFRFASREWLAGLLDAKRIAAHRDDLDTWLVTDAPYFGNTKHRAIREDEGMVWWVQQNLKLDELSDEQKVARDKLIAALSAEAQLPYQREADAKAREEGTIGEGAENSKFFTANSPLLADADYSCVDCHKFYEEGFLGSAPDLTGYGSRPWMLGIVRDPDHERFYAGNNDRMPAFGQDPTIPPRDLELIVDWIREDWYEPESEEAESAPESR